MVLGRNFRLFRKKGIFNVSHLTFHLLDFLFVVFNSLRSIFLMFYVHWFFIIWFIYFLTLLHFLTLSTIFVSHLAPLFFSLLDTKKWNCVLFFSIVYFQIFLNYYLWFTVFIFFFSFTFFILLIILLSLSF